MDIYYWMRSVPYCGHVVSTNREVLLRSNVRRFPRPDLLKQEQAAYDRRELARALADFKGSSVARAVLADHVAVADREIAGRTESVEFREFLMLYTRANRDVVRYLRKESKYKVIAPDVWATLLDHVQDVSYEVLLTREALVREVGASPRAVAQVLKELVDFKALRRLRESEPGKQGRGCVRYFLNARVGSHETHDARIVSFKDADRLGKATVSSERRRRAMLPAMQVL
jgi:hypothetical protein